MAYPRMNEATQEDPGLVILLLGGNDTLRRIPIEKQQKIISARS